MVKRSVPMDYGESSARRDHQAWAPAIALVDPVETSAEIADDSDHRRVRVVGAFRLRSAPHIAGPQSNAPGSLTLLGGGFWS